MAFSVSARRLGALALVGGAAAAAACSSDPDVRGLTTPTATNAPFMLRYVALGNSITAGYQSGGINDSTQRRAFPVLLAAAAGVRFEYPSVVAPGCPAPIANGLTGVRITGDTASTCTVRAGVTDLLNSVAVPGANSFDPTGAAAVTVGSGAAAVTYTGGYSTLTRLFLGNLTQVQKAIQANPTFATVWIGNNDLLGAALQGRAAVGPGDTTAATPLATFTANYAAMINQLRAGSPELQKGILIGVVDVTNTPILIPVANFTPNGQGGARDSAFGAVRSIFGVGTTRLPTFQINFDASCAGSTAAIPFPALAGIARAVPANATSYTFNCATGSSAANPIVTAAERGVFVARVAAYNAYIKAKADSIGFVYYDPNVRLAAYRASGAVLPFPNLAAPTRPYGPLISNDGVHPGNAVHAQLAKDLRDSINTRYGANLADIPVTGVNP